MAGTQPGFSGKDFRRNIRFVMNMGAPVKSEDQATFIFANQLVYNPADDGDFDDNGVPFDPSIPVSQVTPPTKKVPCAIEYFDADGFLTDFGAITPSKAVITLMDEDYEEVAEAIAVVLGGERFNYQKMEAPVGLFDVGLYTMHFIAENDV